jgi:Tol biopolymer transport system component
MSRFSRFDRAVGFVLLGLAIFIGITLLIGDRIGVRLIRVSPLGEAHSTDTILIQFTEIMDRESVEERLEIEPEVPGDFSWSGDTLVFRPAEPLPTGQDFTVTVDEGASSRYGRALLNPYQFSFSVREPWVAWLAPADGFPQNIWMADPNDLENAEQVTFSTSGIFDFAVSPDGRMIAFSERRTDQPATDIKLLNLDDGTVHPLTNCVDSDCASPVWRPDGNMIAYTRVDMNTLLPGVGISPYRIWLLDLTTDPATTQPLFADTQTLGYGPQWSDDGRRISLFDNSIPGVVVYDFDTDETRIIQSDQGSSGALSPDGSELVFPEVVLDRGRAYSRLIVATLDEEELLSLVDPSAPVDDSFAVWRPGGDDVVVGRRYRDERFTPTTQLFLVDSDTGEGEELVFDPQYNHGFVFWDPTGMKVVMQRFPQFDEDGQPNRGGRPEIWTYDIETDNLTQVAVNGMFPRWVP